MNPTPQHFHVEATGRATFADWPLLRLPDHWSGLVPNVETASRLYGRLRSLDPEHVPWGELVEGGAVVAMISYNARVWASDGPKLAEPRRLLLEAVPDYETEDLVFQIHPMKAGGAWVFDSPLLGRVSFEAAFATVGSCRQALQEIKTRELEVAQSAAAAMAAKRGKGRPPRERGAAKTTRVSFCASASAAASYDAAAAAAGLDRSAWLRRAAAAAVTREEGGPNA